MTRQAVDDYPGRFGLFAHLPTPTDIDAALEELTYALDVLGADGVTLTNVYGVGDQARSLGDPIFEPLWAELDRRGALVFLHGEQTPGSNRAPSQFLPTPVSEIPNETYKGAADLVTSGRKRQYPNVRIILSHSGGSTPFLAARVAALGAFHLDCELSPDEILADFRTFYYETALSGFETNLVALENFVEPGPHSVRHRLPCRQPANRKLVHAQRRRVLRSSARNARAGHARQRLQPLTSADRQDPGATVISRQSSKPSPYG